MSSTNKTQHLKLNQWIATDRPIRMDYVEDNRIIDEILGGHINNNTIHLNGFLNERLNTPYVSRMYGGTGDAQLSLTFDFDVNYAIVFALNKPFVSVENSKTYVNSGVSCKSGSSQGVAISGKKVIVSQQSDTSLKEISNLNKQGVMYIVMAFR